MIYTNRADRIAELEYVWAQVSVRQADNRMNCSKLVSLLENDI